MTDHNPIKGTSNNQRPENTNEENDGRRHSVTFHPECVLIPEVVLSDRPRLTLRKYSLPLTSRTPSPYLNDPTFIPSPTTTSTNPFSSLKSISIALPHFTRAPPLPSPSLSTASNGSYGFGSPPASHNGVGMGGRKRRNSRTGSDSEGEGSIGGGSTTGGGPISWGLNRVRSRSRSIDRGANDGLVGCLRKPSEKDGVGISGGSVLSSSPTSSSHLPSSSPSLPSSFSTTFSTTLAKPTLSTVKESGGTATPPNGMMETGERAATRVKDVLQDSNLPNPAMASPNALFTSPTQTNILSRILSSPTTSNSTNPRGTTHDPPFYSSSSSEYGKHTNMTTASALGSGSGSGSGPGSAAEGATNQTRPGLRGRTSSLLSRITSRESAAAPTGAVGTGSSPATGSSGSGSGFGIGLGLRRSISQHSNPSASSSQPTPNPDPTTTNIVPLSSCCSKCLKATNRGLRPESEWEISFSTSARRKIARDSGWSTDCNGKPHGGGGAGDTGMHIMEGGSLVALAGKGLGKVVGVGGGAASCLDPVVQPVSPSSPTSSSSSSTIFKTINPFGSGATSGSGTLSPPNEAEERAELEDDDVPPAESALSMRIKRMGSVDEVERVFRRRESMREESGGGQENVPEETGNAWITSKPLCPSQTFDKSPSEPTPPSIPDPPNPLEPLLTPDELLEVDRLPDQSYFARESSRSAGLKGKKIGISGALPVLGTRASPDLVKSGRFSWLAVGGAKSVPF